jgi:hypothetical protein
MYSSAQALTPLMPVPNNPRLVYDSKKVSGLKTDNVYDRIGGLVRYFQVYELDFKPMVGDSRHLRFGIQVTGVESSEELIDSPTYVEMYHYVRTRKLKEGTKEVTKDYHVWCPQLDVH